MYCAEIMSGPLGVMDKDRAPLKTFDTKNYASHFIRLIEMERNKREEIAEQQSGPGQPGSIEIGYNDDPSVVSFLLPYLVDRDAEPLKKGDNIILHLLDRHVPMRFGSDGPLPYKGEYNKISMKVDHCNRMFVRAKMHTNQMAKLRSTEGLQTFEVEVDPALFTYDRCAS